jgi:hypothetical protein
MIPALAHLRSAEMTARGSGTYSSACHLLTATAAAGLLPRAKTMTTLQ